MPHTDPLRLIQLARTGDDAALGDLLVEYRNYLKLLAGMEIDRRLRRRVDASDIVQEALLRAHRGFQKFRGQTEGELLAWLRRILASSLSDVARQYFGTARRQLGLELEVVESLDDASRVLASGLIDHSTPSAAALQHERCVQLANALAALPNANREAIVLRHLEDLSFSEIAVRMGRSVNSVKKLWIRGLASLRNNWEREG